MSHGTGTFIWNELMARDPAAAEAFYAAVLGWQAVHLDQANPMEPAKPGSPAYTIFMSGEDRAGGMFKMDGPEFDGVPACWMSYVQVPDVDETVDKVIKLGGQVIKPPFDIVGVGRMAVITDPEGAALAIMKPADECAPDA